MTFKNAKLILNLPFRMGVFYPEFMASFSIKYVVPALLGDATSYTGLELSDGVEKMLAHDQIGFATRHVK